MLLQCPVHKDDTLNKKNVKFSKYFNNNYHYEKSVWRLLLNQFYLEQGEYPLRFGSDGYLTEASLNKFSDIMEKFSERIVDTIDILSATGGEDYLTLTFKTGFAERILILRK